MYVQYDDRVNILKKLIMDEFKRNRPNAVPFYANIALNDFWINNKDNVRFEVKWRFDVYLGMVLWMNNKPEQAINFFKPKLLERYTLRKCKDYVCKDYTLDYKDDILKVYNELKDYGVIFPKEKEVIKEIKSLKLSSAEKQEIINNKIEEERKLRELEEQRKELEQRKLKANQLYKEIKEEFFKNTLQSFQKVLDKGNLLEESYKEFLSPSHLYLVSIYKAFAYWGLDDFTNTLNIYQTNKNGVLELKEEPFSMSYKDYFKDFFEKNGSKISLPKRFEYWKKIEEVK